MEILNDKLNSEFWFWFRWKFKQRF
jgi:hypothetical protein